MCCFILYISLALLIRPGSGMALPLDSGSDEVQEPAVLDMKSIISLKNAAEITQLLKLINKGNVKNKSLQRQNSEPGIDIDYLGVSDEKSDIVNELMKMIKKNNSNKEKQVVRPSDRLVYISNPEVLEEYKKQQKTKHRAVSLDSDEGEGDDSIATKHLLDVLQHLRRFDQLKDQNEEKEAELDRPDKSIGTFTIVKSKDDNQISLRTGRESKYDSDDGKFDSSPSKNDAFESKHDAFESKNDNFESKHDNFDIKPSKLKHDGMKNSGERPRNTWLKKKEEDRFKDARYSDELNSKKNRNQKKKAKGDSMLSKMQMQDNPSFGNFGSMSKARPKPVSKPKLKRERERERIRPRDTNGAPHSYGRTPVPYVGKRGIYEEVED